YLHTQGEIMGWLNADDKYLPWTFAVIAELMGKPRTTSNGECNHVALTGARPAIEWLTSLFPLFWDEQGRAVHCEAHEGYSRQLVLRGGTLPGCGWAAWTFLQQEATFWRRSLWERAGGQVDTAYSLAADYDLWMRFAQQAEIYCAAVPLGGFRRHPGQKTGSHMREYVRQSRESFIRHGGRPPGKLQSFCLKNVGKLLRYFQRRQTFACTQQGFSNRC